MLVTLALLAIACAGWLYANGNSLRFAPLEQDAGDLLDQVVAGSGLPVSQASATDRIAADGTVPDTAMRTLVIPANADAARAGFRKGCHRAGLGAPDAATLGADPDALCAGSWRRGSATRSVQLRCAAVCRAGVSVYHLWF